MQEQQTRRLDLLDYARLLAALCVLAFHYFFNGIANGKIGNLRPIPFIADIAKYGYLGVEFFFLISGYVIFFSAREKSPGAFAASRAARLYPAFWACVLVTAGFCAVLGGPALAVDVRQVLLNLTMLPIRLGARPVDGVYWTLQVELQFYALVLLLLLAGLRRHLDSFFLLWPLLMLVAFAAGRPNLPMLGGYAPLFAAGAMFAMMRERVTVAALASLAACLFLALFNAVGFSQQANLIKGAAYSPAIVAGIVVVEFACFFALNTRRGLALHLPGARLAGALTYPIYLLHANIGYILLSRFATDANRALAYPLVIAAVIGLAWAVHKLAERRMASLWTFLFTRILARPLDASRAWLVAPLRTR